MELTADERGMRDGRDGEAAATAMRILVETAEVMGASRLLAISRAHIDGCLYHGEAGLAFAELLRSQSGRVAVPTTLNVASLDLVHPGRVRLDPETSSAGRRLMDAYVAMGCRPTWTCAPYQLPGPPRLGEQIAWAESNAIVFANSVLGARTERYGDFIDVCCALTGRAPAIGLHTDEGRRARAVVRIGDDVPPRLLDEPAGLAALGHVIGLAVAARIPAIVGLPAATGADGLKALGAAAASSGAVAMFHAVGVTPEAPSLDAALGGGDPDLEVVVGAADLRAARDELGAAGDRPLAAVSLGTPHASTAELHRILAAIERARPTVPLYVNVARDTLSASDADRLAASGVTVVSDTCTYLVPVIAETDGCVMTDSAKWAWYAPANLGLRPVFGTTEECLRSASLGLIWRDDAVWGT